jgi:hypothetical protein
VPGHLSNQQANKSFAVVLKDIKSSVEQGASFSDRCGVIPRCSISCSSTVQAGEVGGILDTIMNRLSVSRETAKLLRRCAGADYLSVVGRDRGRRGGALDLRDSGFRADVRGFRRRKRCRRSRAWRLPSHGFVTYLGSSRSAWRPDGGIVYANRQPRGSAFIRHC